MAGRVCSHLKAQCNPTTRKWFRTLQARCSAAAHAGTSSNTVPTPLCKRPPNYCDTLSNLLSWQHAVEKQIDRIGDQFEVEDQGPSAQDMKREVHWVLEDILAEVQYTGDQHWQPCEWRQLQMELRLAGHKQQDVNRWKVKLRAPVQQLHDWWQQRLQDRVPFQYLINTAHWREYILSIGPGVLIPRPETEIFPELVQQALTSRPALAALPWVDLGTGSGAIAISVAEVLRKHNKNAKVFAVDISPVAAAYARANVSSTGLDHLIIVVEGSWLQPVLLHLSQGNKTQNAVPQMQDPQSSNNQSQLQTHLPLRSTSNQLDSVSQSSRPISECQQANTTNASGVNTSPEYAEWPMTKLGGIVSNPPYIPRGVMETGLQAEVGKHEPWLALDGGPGPGLDSLQVICQQAASALASGGFLALEVGLATSVTAMFQTPDDAKGSGCLMQLCVLQLMTLFHLYVVHRQVHGSGFCLFDAL